MSKYGVKSAFQDKFTKVHYPVDSAYESDDADRVAFLKEKGFLGEEVLEAIVVKDQESHEEGTLVEKKGKNKNKKPPESPPNE
jgi:hypothetical protein